MGEILKSSMNTKCINIELINSQLNPEKSDNGYWFEPPPTIIPIYKGSFH